jgi:hypothetical protein
MSILVHRSPAMFAVDTEVVEVTRRGYLPNGPDKTAWPFTMQGGDSILCPAPATRRSRGVPLPSPGVGRKALGDPTLAAKFETARGVTALTTSDARSHAPQSASKRCFGDNLQRIGLRELAAL